MGIKNRFEGKNLLPAATAILCFVLYLNLKQDFERTLVDWIVIGVTLTIFIVALFSWIRRQQKKRQRNQLESDGNETRRSLESQSEADRDIQSFR